MIKSKWPAAKINHFNSICPVTENKKTEALKLQTEADISFIIGDPLSSNASKLSKILKNADTNTWFIQDAADLKQLNLNLKTYKAAMVVSSASTPYFVEAMVIDYLEGI